MADKILKYPGEKFREFFDREIEKYKKAVKNNPKDASDHVGLAESYINSWCYGFLPRDKSLPFAKSAVVKAIQLDRDSALVHTFDGILKLTDWDWSGAEQELKLATVMDPVNYKSRHWFSLFLAAMGRYEEAIREAKTANELESPAGSKIGYGSILYFAHEFEQMFELLEKAIIDEPDEAPLYDWLGMAYVQLGQYDKSIEVYRKAAELSDGLAEIMAGLGHAYGVAGRIEEAKEVLNEMLACAERWYVPPVQIAFVALSIGDKNLTFELLERAYAERSWELIFLRTEPWFDILHDDPRFRDFICGLNFPDL